MLQEHWLKVNWEKLRNYRGKLKMLLYLKSFTEVCQKRWKVFREERIFREGGMYEGRVQKLGYKLMRVVSERKKKL